MSQSPRTKGQTSAVSPRYANAITESTATSSNNGQVMPCPPRPLPFNPQQGNEPVSTVFLPPVAAITGESESRYHAAVPQRSPQWRSTGIQSILNPASDLSKRYAPIFASPTESSVGRAPSVIGIPSFPSPRMRKRGDSQSPSHGIVPNQEPARMDRRILTPKSPGLRATSLGHRRSPSLHRATSRAGDGRVCTAEPGQRIDAASVPPMPPLPAPKSALSTSYATPGVSEHYGTSVPGLTPSHSLGSIINTQAPPVLQPANPPSLQRSPSVLSQSQTPVPKSEVPPGFNPAPTPTTRPGDHYTHQGWMLALEGGDVGVHVDNQQASKMADEKRKRNAGASARFRARRKEREKEASQTISGLQGELRGMADDRDFYMNERNILREFIARHHLGPSPPRPPSPPIRRVHGLASTSHDSDLSSDYGRRETTEMPEQGIQVNDFQPSFPQASAPAGPMPPNNMPYYGTYSPSSGPQYPFPHAPSASSLSDARAAPPSAPSMSLPRPLARDTFARDILERNWNAGK